MKSRCSAGLLKMVKSTSPSCLPFSSFESRNVQNVTYALSKKKKKTAKKKKKKKGEALKQYVCDGERKGKKEKE